MIKKLFHGRDIALWVTALILSFLLWGHVASEKIYDMTITLPVREVGLPRGLLLAAPPPDSIALHVTGTGKRLWRDDWRTAGVSVRIDEHDPGAFHLPLTRDNVTLLQGEQITMGSVLSPRLWTFVCDHPFQKQTPVISRITVTTSPGFALQDELRVTPENVLASGPRRSITQLTAAYTEERTLSNVSNSATIGAVLTANSAYGVSFDPPSAQVSFAVIPVMERAFDSLIVVLYNSPNDSVVSTPDFVSLRVSGPAETIRPLRSEDIIVSADYLRRDSAGKTSLKVSLPPRVTLVSLTDTTTTFSTIR